MDRLTQIDLVWRPTPPTGSTRQAEAERIAAENKAKEDARRAVVNDLQSARQKLGIAPAKQLSTCLCVFGGLGVGMLMS